MTEMDGLPNALARLFPAANFTALNDRPERPFEGFTSGPLPDPPDIPTELDKIVGTIASLVDPDLSNGWDLVVAIDDLELVNRGKADRAVDTIRSAFIAHLDKFQDPRRTRLQEAFRQKVSVHLAVPMIESWFFAAPTALTSLGVGSETSFHVQPGDPEDFVSTDKQYIAAKETDCTKWCRRRLKKDRPHWISAGADRVFHPKGYLQWLLKDSNVKNCTQYKPGREGSRVLRNIVWEPLLGDPQRMKFARALIEDLALGLGQEPAIDNWEGTLAQETSVSTLPPNPILRNM